MKFFKLNLLSTALASVVLSQTAFSAYNDSGTDFSTALTEAQAFKPWVNDRANEPTEIANILTCLMREGGLGVTGTANQTFLAVVNEANCGINDGSGVSYAQLTVQSSHASDSSPQEITAWLEQANGNQFIMQGQVSASPTSSNPWGIVNVRFKRADVLQADGSDFDATTDMHGWFRTTTDGTDITLESSSAEFWPEYGENLENRAKAVLNGGSTDDVSYVAYSKTTDTSSNTSSEDSYIGKASATQLWSQTINSSDALTGSAQCKARDEQWITGFTDRLFYKNDTTVNGATVTAGSEVNLSADIDFTSTINGEDVGGALAFWGMWLSNPNQNHWTMPTDHTTTTSGDIYGRKITINEKYGDQRQGITVYQAGGNLQEKSSVSYSASTFPTGLVLSVWDGSNQFNGMTWNGSNRFTKTGSQTANLVTVGSGFSNGVPFAFAWTNAFPSRNFEIQKDSSGNLELVERVRNRVQSDNAIVDTTTPTRLVCSGSNGNCYAPGSVLGYGATVLSHLTNSSSPEFLYNPAKATTGLPGTLYYDHPTLGTSGTLDTNDVPVVFDFYYPDRDNSTGVFVKYDGTGTTTQDAENSTVGQYAWLDMPLSEYNSSDCKASDTSGCNASGRDQYAWQISPNIYSQQQFAYESDGTAITFDTPIQLTFSYSAITDDANGGINSGQRATTVAEGRWNPFTDSVCSTSGGCSETFDVSNYVNTSTTTNWGGRSLWFQYVQEGEYWLREANPASGEVTFTDSNGTEYVHVTSGFEAFLTDDTASCSNALNAPETGLAYANIPGFGFDDDSPIVSANWEDKPADADVDQTCIIRSGVIFEDGAKADTCSAW